MSLNKILEEQLEKISPSKKEIDFLKNLSEDFIKKLEAKSLKAFVGGSLAKGTLVKKEKQDVDIFVVFDSEKEILNLEKVLGKIKIDGKLKKVHGSRDYFQIDVGKTILEIIPVVRNEDPELAKNVTDVSLSHVKYVKSEIKKNPKIADEIRLAKSFCQANKFYGAESYIRGFSGYSLEVLVIYFGSFVKFLKGIKKKRVIDPKKYFKNSLEVQREINSSKISGPLVVVDPTFKYRNVCAGLGLETFEKFVRVSEEFLKKPTKEFFIKKEIDVEELKIFGKRKRARLVEIDLTTNRQEGDIAGTKMKKLLDFFCSELERKGQKVLRREFSYSGKGNRAKGYLVVDEVFDLEIRGPTLNLKDACLKFKKARQNVTVKKGRLYSREKISVEKVFDLVKKVQNEMGASGKIVFR